MNVFNFQLCLPFSVFKSLTVHTFSRFVYEKNLEIPFSGMVGLQRPQGEPGLKLEDLEEDNKMICLSNQDEFVLTQVNIDTENKT